VRLPSETPTTVKQEKYSMMRTDPSTKKEANHNGESSVAIHSERPWQSHCSSNYVIDYGEA
jgi:hypothetical protein